METCKETPKVNHKFILCKSLAVKRVITNKGKNTPGIDGDIWSTDRRQNPGSSQPYNFFIQSKAIEENLYRKVWEKEKRPLGIPTMTDRAMQGLQLLALAPIAETTADKVSFGFRQNRCAQDAMEYMFKLLSRKTSRNGFWKVTLKDALITSAMTGCWKISQVIKE